MLQKWVKAVRLEGFTPTKHTLICSMYYEPNDEPPEKMFDARCLACKI